MPTLPSGLHLALTSDHIMDPDRNWFKAPEGHFWYWVPADDAVPPPYSPEKSYEQQPATAPVPTTREMAERYVRVGIGTSNGMMYWRGEMLSEFPKYGGLSDEDSKAWLEWLSLKKVGKFLDSVIIQCQTQAEINQEAKGYAVFKARQGEGGDDDWVAVEKNIDNPLKNSH